MVKRFGTKFALVGAEVFQPDAYFDLDRDARRYVSTQLASNPRVDRGLVFDTVSGQVVFTLPDHGNSLHEKSETSPKVSS